VNAVTVGLVHGDGGSITTPTGFGMFDIEHCKRFQAARRSSSEPGRSVDIFLRISTTSWMCERLQMCERVRSLVFDPHLPQPRLFWPMRSRMAASQVAIGSRRSSVTLARAQTRYPIPNYCPFLLTSDHIEIQTTSKNDECLHSLGSRPRRTPPTAQPEDPAWHSAGA
jgi:hypothetical protein